MRHEYFEKGLIIFKQDELAMTMFFIESGCVELYTLLDGEEFILERLYRGSVLNHNAFLLADTIDISCRAKISSRLIYLDISTVNSMLIITDCVDIRNKCLYLD